MWILIAVTVPYSPCLKSISASQTAIVRFINQGSQTLTIYWVNYQGSAVFFGTLRSGDTYTLYTYTTHPWLVANPRDEVVAVFAPYTTASDTASNTDIVIKYGQYLRVLTLMQIRSILKCGFCT